MLVLVCGLPASGKTTVTRGLRRRLDARGHLFETLHSGDYDRDTYDRMYDAVAAGIEAGRRDWLLDGTFYLRDHRTRFYRLGDTYEVWARASLETCLERNREREEPIPERGLGAIAARFEPPRADLEVDTEGLDPEATLDRAEAAVLDWLA